MITLDKYRKLQVVMDATATTTESPIQAAFNEINSRQVETAQEVDSITTGNTAVDVIPTPSAGSKRKLTALSVYNADSVARIVTVQLVSTVTGSSQTRKVVSVTLQTGEALYYSQHTGFYCVDVNGNQKSNAPASSGAASTANSIATAGSSQASSLAAGIVVASVNSVSSQASSIAAQNPNTVSSLQSAASVQSFTSTTWSTVSSATSRVKSSFSW
jgi:hypothetical protein